MVKWSEPLGKALGFCWHPKRWLPLFILKAGALALVLLYLYQSLDSLLTMMISLSSGSTAYITQFYGFLSPLLLIGIVYALLCVWVKGALVYQGWKEKEFRQSWRLSCKRYPSLLAAVILAGIVVYIASLDFLVLYVPSAAVLGALLAFIASAALYFPLQIIMIRKQGALNSLMGSWQLFKDQFREKLITRKNLLILIIISELLTTPMILLPNYLTLQLAVLIWLSSWILIFIVLFLLAFSRVINAMILVAIVSAIILLVFSIPLMLVLWNIFLTLAATASLNSGTLVLLEVVEIIKTGLPAILASGLIALAGVSISRVFSLKAKTEYYLQFRKKLLGLF